MEQKFCQSCGMPLTEEILGTNADGSKNEDYFMNLCKATLEEFDSIVAFYDDVTDRTPDSLY